MTHSNSNPTIALLGLQKLALWDSGILGGNLAHMLNITQLMEKVRMNGLKSTSAWTSASVMGFKSEDEGSNNGYLRDLI